jgi:hypothetical protein
MEDSRQGTLVGQQPRAVDIGNPGPSALVDIVTR